MEMTQEWIAQYNQKCAEFLGYVNTTPTDKDFNIYKNEKGMIIGNKIYTMLETMSMKFHSDWNWIHEVKDKIRTFPAVNFSVTNNYVFINTVERTKNGGIGHTLGSYQGSSEKEATIQAIDQFINCYNKQKEA